MGALEKLRETAQKIRESVYGVEVREDIAEGFENVVDAQNEYEAATTVKLENKLNADFGQFADELSTGVSEYVNTRVEERIVEVMDDLSDDNLRSEIQQARNSAAYAVNYGSVDARLEADEAKLKDVVSEVNAARNSTANGKTYSNLDSRLEEDESRVKVVEDKVGTLQQVPVTLETGNMIDVIDCHDIKTSGLYTSTYQTLNRPGTSIENNHFIIAGMKNYSSGLSDGYLLAVGLQSGRVYIKTYYNKKWTAWRNIAIS